MSLSIAYYSEDEPVQNFLESLPSSTPSTLVVADDEDSNSFASFRFKSSSEEENIARIPPKQTRSSTSQQNTSVNDTWSKDTDNLSWPEDDEDDDDLTEETEQDFIMSSTKNVRGFINCLNSKSGYYLSLTYLYLKTIRLSLDKLLFHVIFLRMHY